MLLADTFRAVVIWANSAVLKLARRRILFTPLPLYLTWRYSNFTPSILANLCPSKYLSPIILL